MGVVESRPEACEDCEESMLSREEEEGVWLLDKAAESDRGPISRLVSVDDGVPQELVEEREVCLCPSSLCQGGFSWSSTAGVVKVLSLLCHDHIINCDPCNIILLL